MASQPDQTYRLGGIVFGPSPYSVPDGSLLPASLNVVMRDLDTIEARRGLERMFRALQYDKIIEYEEALLLHRASDGQISIVQSPFTTVTRTNAGAALNPSASRKVQTASAGNRLFLTSSTGVKVLDSLAANIRDVGGPIAPGFDPPNPGAGTTIPNNKRVAYRYTLGRVTETGVQIIGAPSGRIVYENTSGAAQDLELEMKLPTGLDETYFFQVWRSGTVDLTIQPEDDLRLVYERTITGLEASAAVASFVDVCPDSLRGEYLYTSPNAGEGIQNANSPPPIADHVVLHKNRLWLGATTTRNELTLRLLAVGGNGLANTDVIVFVGLVSGFTLTAGVGRFIVVTGGSASFNVEQTALNLVDAINFEATNSEIWAEYVSGPDDVPGEIRIYSRAPNGPAVFVYTDMQSGSARWSHRDAFSPQLPPIIEGAYGGRTFSLTRVANVVTATVSAGNITGMLAVGERVMIFNPSGSFGAGPHTVTAITGTTFTYTEVGVNAGPLTFRTVQFYSSELAQASNEGFINRIYYSKPYEYEAFPGGNYTDVGASDKAIVAMRVTRETLWVFKEDGLFRITGDDEDTFDVERVDATIIALATEAVVNFAEAIVAWTTKGLIQISESTFDVLSEPIDKLLREYLLKSATSATDLLSSAFIVADTREGLIRLHLGGNSIDDSSNLLGAGEALVFSTITKTWNRWKWDSSIGSGFQKCLTHGIIHSTKRQAFYANPTFTSIGEGSLLREKTELASKPYADAADDTGLDITFLQRLDFLFNYGKAPLLEKRFDEVALLFVDFPPSGIYYRIASEGQTSTDQLAGQVALDGIDIYPNLVLDVSNSVRVVRIQPSFEYQRGQRIYVGLEFTPAAGNVALKLHGYSVLLEVLNGSLSR